MSAHKTLRTIRTFVMRQGRMTPSQQYAIDHYWLNFGIPTQNQPFDYKALFHREAPVIVEIGFGMGDSIIEMAKANPVNNYIGIEVHPPGVGRCLHLLVSEQLTNLRLCNVDALTVFDTNIPDNSLAGIQIFFPDPWHKKKHHKRRLINPKHLSLFCQKLKAGGFLHIATDWEAYALTILEDLNASKTFDALEDTHQSKQYRVETKFERRGQRLGHKVFDFRYQKVGE